MAYRCHYILNRAPIINAMFIAFLSSSPGDFHNKGYLTSRHERTGRRERRVYDITEQGRTALADAKTKVKELFGELVEGG